MKRYLSFGGGVNSTALMLYLTDQKIDFETVFIDHGTDYPHTYEYVKYLQSQGFSITIIKPNVQGFSNLYEYCKAKKFIPSLQKRWCTYRFKLKPIWQYVKRPCTIYVGISIDENQRIRQDPYYKVPKSITIEYPLINAQLSREDCIKIIKSHNLKVPQKSGCFICPAQSPRQILRLYVEYPELFKKVMELEKVRGHTLKDRPFSSFVPLGTPPLLHWGDSNA
jgi:3'-phosphoadenosine 5'-phosphosulfate sulfotransferase (PAPS reductase)/FAD synthetase